MHKATKLCFRDYVSWTMACRILDLSGFDMVSGTKFQRFLLVDVIVIVFNALSLYCAAAVAVTETLFVVTIKTMIHLQFFIRWESLSPPQRGGIQYDPRQITLASC